MYIDHVINKNEPQSHSSIIQNEFNATQVSALDKIDGLSSVQARGYTRPKSIAKFKLSTASNQNSKFYLKNHQKKEIIEHYSLNKLTNLETKAKTSNDCIMNHFDKTQKSNYLSANPNIAPISSQNSTNTSSSSSCSSIYDTKSFVPVSSYSVTPSYLKLNSIQSNLNNKNQNQQSKLFTINDNKSDTFQCKNNQTKYQAFNIDNPCYKLNNMIAQNHESLFKYPNNELLLNYQYLNMK